MALTHEEFMMRLFGMSGMCFARYVQGPTQQARLSANISANMSNNLRFNKHDSCQTFMLVNIKH